MPNSKLPLEHIRVVDFTWYAAGPLCTRVLANHGAQVIKIESRARLDVVRIVGPKPPGNKSINVSGYFNNCSSDKLGVSLDLKKPEGLNIVKRLIGISDIVIDNFSASVLDRWGLTYENVVPLKPDVIMVRMSPMGLSGPWRDAALLGNHLAAMAGLYHLSGYPDRPPVGPGTAFADYTYNPFHAATALLAALHHRNRTGEGQLIDLSQYESTVAALGHFVLDAAANKRALKRTGNRSPYTAPHGVYRCRGEDRWCAIAVSTDEKWQALCRALGDPPWSRDPKFATALSRLRHQDDLDAHIEVWTSQRTPREVMELLQAAGVSAGAVHDARDLVEDPQLRARGQYPVLDHPEAGPTVYDGPTFPLSKTPGSVRRPAPLLGQHTDYVLTELLGLAEEQVNAYILEEIIA